jgi:hypothetical protein
LVSANFLFAADNSFSRSSIRPAMSWPKIFTNLNRQAKLLRFVFIFYTLVRPFELGP